MSSNLDWILTLESNRRRLVSLVIESSRLQTNGGGDATMDNSFDLQRFVDAQSGVYDAVRAELRAGRKRSHWIWFVFPQLTELGRSPTARFYGITGAAEARAYLAHPVLGPRLRECARMVTAIDARSAEEIFGFPDHLKVRSCMTLFARCAEDDGDFTAVLDTFYRGYPDGREDPDTVDMLASSE
jgi:uncharacterized protein (DUF1810 family)